MIQFKHLNGLLSKITAEQIHDSFKVECIYSDGMDNTILKISFFNVPQSKVFGQIAFQRETGAVKKCIYKNHRFPDADNIIDALLDVYNYQKSVSGIAS